MIDGVACSCITCGDEAIPLRVLELDETGLALCEDDQGRRETVEMALVDPVDPGDACWCTRPPR